MMAIFSYRTASLELSDSSSSLIGQNKVSLSQGKGSLISLVKYIKQRNSLDKKVPSLYTAGEWCIKNTIMHFCIPAQNTILPIVLVTLSY